MAFNQWLNTASPRRVRTTSVADIKKAGRTGPRGTVQLHCRLLEPFGRRLNCLAFVASFDLAEAR